MLRRYKHFARYRYNFRCSDKYVFNYVNKYANVFRNLLASSKYINKKLIAMMRKYEKKNKYMNTFFLRKKDRSRSTLQKKGIISKINIERARIVSSVAKEFENRRKEILSLLNMFIVELNMFIFSVNRAFFTTCDSSVSILRYACITNRTVIIYNNMLRMLDTDSFIKTLCKKRSILCQEILFPPIKALMHYITKHVADEMYYYSPNMCSYRYRLNSKNRQRKSVYFFLQFIQNYFLRVELLSTYKYKWRIIKKVHSVASRNELMYTDFNFRQELQYNNGIDNLYTIFCTTLSCKL